MKTTYGWYEDGGYGGGTNSSGFSGLPGGSRVVNGSFYLAGYDGYWWSSSANGYDAWSRFLNSTIEDVYRFYLDPREGFSVRCVRDAE